MARIIKSALVAFVFLFSFAFIPLNANRSEAHELVVVKCDKMISLMIRNNGQPVNRKELLRSANMDVTLVSFNDLKDDKEHYFNVRKYLEANGKPATGVFNVVVLQYMDEENSSVVKETTFNLETSNTSPIGEHTNGVFVDDILIAKVVNGKITGDIERISITGETETFNYEEVSRYRDAN